MERELTDHQQVARVRAHRLEEELANLRNQIRLGQDQLDRLLVANHLTPVHAS